jgi:hypothetical protein
MLPYEPHWYAARESNEQPIYEMVRWFDKHVKDAPANRDGPGHDSEPLTAGCFVILGIRQQAQTR